MRQKGFAPIIILLVLVVIGLSIYLGILNKTSSQMSSPSPAAPNQTANWKTYQSSDQNFSFKYPDNFESKTSTARFVVFSAGNDDFLLTAKVDTDSEKYLQEFEDSSPANIQKVGSISAYFNSLQSAGGDYSFSRYITIPTDSYVIQIAISPKDENNFAQAEKLGDQIFSTFKFIK